MTIQILRWWLVVEILGLVGLPWSIWLFRRLPDHGLSFAKALGILLVGYGGWLLSSVGLGSFSVLPLILVAVVVAGSGLAMCRRSKIGPLATLRRHIAWVTWQEGLFAGALLLGLLLRWHAPWGFTISHTEMNMDFMFLNGILSSSSFPPQDPWLAGYPINYYYFGYLLIALLTRLSGLASEVTFTLALPTIFALTAVGAAGLVWNATGLWRERGAGSDEPAGPTEAATRSRIPALRLFCATLGAVLVLLLANQSAALMYLTGLPTTPALSGRELLSALEQSATGAPTVHFNPPTAQVSDPAEWSNLTDVPRHPGKQVGDVFWWPSRSVWDTSRDQGTRSRHYAITEFPLFSFILGDLHPHVLSLPWTLLALALALNLLSRRAAPDFLQSGSGRAELVLTAIILGSLYAINSWDLPTYLLCYLVALLLLYGWLAGDLRRILWPHFVIQAAAVILAAYILWLPFYLAFTSLVGGKGFPIGPAPARTELHAFVIIFGAFIVPLLAILFQRARRAQVSASVPAQGTFGIASSAQQVIRPSLALSWPLLTGLVFVVGNLVGWPLAWLLPLAGWALSAAYASPDRGRASALLLLALGAAVVWGTDVVFIRDVFNSRMNTIFKFYYQVWLIWGTGSAVALFFLLRRLRATTLLWLVPWAMLLGGGSFYLFLAPNWKPVQATLNGLAHLDHERPGELQAIRWIREHVPGDAVVLEAPGGGYNSPYGVISMATGRPTIIGWSGHESQWRGGQPQVLNQLTGREQDAGLIYTTPDRTEAEPLLERYNVQYVVVGQNERDYLAQHSGPPTGLTKFGSWMQNVYEADGVVIYKRGT